MHLPLLATITLQDWLWSGGLIEFSLVLATLLGAFWLLGRRR